MYVCVRSETANGADAVDDDDPGLGAITSAAVEEMGELACLPLFRAALPG